MGTSSLHTISYQSTAKVATGTVTSTNTNTKTKPKSKSRSSNQKQNRLYTKAVHPSSQTKNQQPAPAIVDVNDSLAICLLGYNAHKTNLNQNRKMYDSEYEEEVRKQAVMQEVLPDAVMWKKWEATEAPLRQGRGWYPTLDRHFLELLVISEIHCLSHPLQSYNNPNPSANAERIHRHASRVRRVACDRIGAERLHAYCDRVKEAFEAYVQGGWGNGASDYNVTKSELSDVDADEIEGGPDLDVDVDGDEEGVTVKLGSAGDVGVQERGRGLEREGSALKQKDLGPSPPTTTSTSTSAFKDDNDNQMSGDQGDMDVSMVVDVSPLSSPIPSLSHTDSDGEDAETTWDEAEGDLHKINLEGVIEVPEDEADDDTARYSEAVSSGKSKNGMDVDIVLGGNDQIPKIHIITPTHN